MGFIYLIENVVGNEVRHKIGFTKDLERRVKQLDTGNPGEMNIIKHFETKWNRKLESYIQRTYSIKNVKNEWFNLSDNDVNEFLDECEKTEVMFDMMYKENYFFRKNYKL